MEKTPAVIKKGLKKEEAEALKAKLEAGMLARGAHMAAVGSYMIQSHSAEYACISHFLGVAAVGGKISLK